MRWLGIPADVSGHLVRLLPPHLRTHIRSDASDEGPRLKGIYLEDGFISWHNFAELLINFSLPFSFTHV